MDCLTACSLLGSPVRDGRLDVLEGPALVQAPAGLEKRDLASPPFLLPLLPL